VRILRGSSACIVGSIVYLGNGAGRDFAVFRPPASGGSLAGGLAIQAVSCRGCDPRRHRDPLGAGVPPVEIGELYLWLFVIAIGVGLLSSLAGAAGRGRTALAFGGP
jgi:hypothetical protein